MSLGSSRNCHSSYWSNIIRYNNTSHYSEPIIRTWQCNHCGPSSCLLNHMPQWQYRHKLRYLHMNYGPAHWPGTGMWSKYSSLGC